MNIVCPVIRITPDQVDLVAPLFDAYRQFYNQAGDLDGSHRFLSERLQRNESVVFAAIQGGQGHGFTQLYPSFSSISMRTIWVLNDLFVAPQARGRGIATKLVQAACQHARSTGAVRLTLSTGIENTTAQHLYENLGWHRISGFYNYELNLVP